MPAAFYPQEHFWYSFLLRGWVNPRAIVRLKVLSKLKKCISSGIRTGDLPAYSIMPELTTLPRALMKEQSWVNLFEYPTNILIMKYV
jgi:hypothetical protein